MDAADINGASSVQRAMCEHISHHRDRGCGLPRSRSSSVLFCQHCCQHVATAMPCPPCRTPPRCSRLCRGRAPLMRFVQDAAKSQRSPGPPGRLRLHCVCVCVCVGDVMFQCRSMCFLLSGRLPFAIRLLLLSVGLAVASLSPSVSVSGARVIRCSPTPVPFALSDVLYSASVSTVALRVRAQMLRSLSASLHTTPHPFITHHTTQYPHTSSHHNHAYQPSSLPPTTTHSCHTSLRWRTVYCMPADALSVLDQVYPIFPKL